MRLFIRVLMTLGCAQFALCALKCEIRTNRQASNYELSSETRSALDFSGDRSDQSTSGFQGMECTCDNTVSNTVVEYKLK